MRAVPQLVSAPLTLFKGGGGGRGDFEARANFEDV